MMKRKQRNRVLGFCIACTFFLIFTGYNTQAQYNYNFIVNGSLNGDTGRGAAHFPIDWGACDSYSSPDMYSVYISTTNEYIYPYRDTTFLFLRTRSKYHTNAPGPYTYEYITQKLRRPLKKDTTYMFGINYCFNAHMIVQDTKNPNIAYPVRIELWVGHDSCAHDKLLMQTEPLTATVWSLKKCTFTLTDTSYEYIRIATAWDSMNIGPTHESYNGMILIDSLFIYDSIGIIHYFTDFLPAEPIKTTNVNFLGDGKTTLSASPGTAYSWLPEENLREYNVQYPVMTGFTPHYYVAISSLSNCSTIEDFNIILDCDILYPQKVPDTTVIYFNPHKRIFLKASDGQKYSWNPNTHLLDTTTCCPQLTGYDSLINVTVWDKYLCPFNEEFKIELNCDTIVPNKSILTIDTIVGEQAGIKLIPSYGEVDSIWNPTKWLSCSSCREPIASPDNSIIYKVRLKDEYNCFHQEIFKIDVEFFIPNVITPNGDNKNDRFKITGLPENTTLKIYSKSGVLVYSANPYNDSNLWEGTDNDGKPLESNNYWYILENKEKKLLVKGFVFLLR